jgi:response regulator RpfG family c-di-GMP phosphodiesterase
VYDALVTQRQDGTRYTEAQARAFIAARRGVWWSAWVVDAFLKTC